MFCLIWQTNGNTSCLAAGRDRDIETLLFNAGPSVVLAIMTISLSTVLSIVTAAAAVVVIVITTGLK